MNCYKVSYTTQGETGKMNHWDLKVVAETPEAASEAVLTIYSESTILVAITEVEALALAELF